MSSETGEGFDVRIAEILADELGADLAFEWTRFDQQTLERTVHAGACDLVIGVAEDAGGLISTVPYLRTPYVFVERADDPVGVASLDDEAIAELRIGTYQTGLPSIALRNRGVEDDVVEYAPVASPGGPDRDTPILDAVADGDVDLAIVYGPAAAQYAAENPGSLNLAPVQPEIDVGASLIQFFRIWTIGVRPHDEALRDRLNLALAARWEDVQQAIADHGVPQLPVQRPMAGVDDTAFVNAALVGPIDVPASPPEEVLGTAAWQGASLAENVIGLDDDREDATYRMLYANAPTDAAVERAARRLVATEDVVALVGGFTDAQAVFLSELADEAGIAFFNVASISDDLRRERCRPGTFHVAADASSYVAATGAWYVDRGRTDWLVIHEEDEAGASLADRAARVLDDVGASDVELVGVPPGGLVFTEAVRAIEDGAYDVALLLLDPSSQDLLLAQAGGREGDRPVVGLSHPLLQTRVRLHRLEQTAAGAGAAPRPVLWDASLAEGEAAELNERFLSRTGVPMEATAWAAYAASMILYHAVEAGVTEGEGFTAFLEDPGTTFELGKDAPLSFRAADHQLRQPLYIVALDENAVWSRSGATRVDMVEVLDTIPASESSVPDSASGPSACGG